MILSRAGMVLLTWIAVGLSVQAVEDKGLPTIFDEKFDSNPHSRFRMLPVSGPGDSTNGTGKYDEAKHAYVLGGYLSLVRPVPAGPFVEWNLSLTFEKPAADSTALETDLMLVLMDQSLAGIQMVRSTKADVPGKIRFVQQRSGQTQDKVLKEIPLPAQLDGAWLLRYRHGLLTLVQDSKTLGSVDLARLGVSVAGVSWIQKGGEVTCQKMSLKGEPARKLEKDDQELLKRASGLNMEARKLFIEKKPDEALAKMEEASGLFIKVHGENHHDSGNSITNLASIFESTGKAEEAGKRWAKALAIHEATLGAAHPHTTLTRFNYGKYLLSQGEQAKAKEMWIKCRNDWKEVFGPDYPMVKSLDSLLANL